MKWMKTALSRKLRLLGEKATILRENGETEVVALITPVSSLSQAARTALSLPDGVYPPGTYEYVGPAEEDIGDSQCVISGGKRYYVRRSEIIRTGGEALFCWGLMLGGGDDEAD